MIIGERVRKRRLELGLSQRELARRLGVRYATLSDLERGVREEMTIGLLRKLAKALGVTSDWLIGMYEDEQSEREPVSGALVGASAHTGKEVLKDEPLGE
jgi:XRE family transcriptional regulator of biofilm formation